MRSRSVLKAAIYDLLFKNSIKACWCILLYGLPACNALTESTSVCSALHVELATFEVVSAIPSVGENYQDHHLLIYSYYSSMEETETLDALFSGRLDVAKAIESNAPILGWNSQDVTGKLRPTEPEVAELGSAFQKKWDEEYKNNPNKPLVNASLANW